MFRINIIILLVWLMGGANDFLAARAFAQQTKDVPKEFHLLNGDILKGEVASANEEGLVVRLAVGGFSDRVAWPKFTQETLQVMTNTPALVKYAEPFIEVPLELKPKKATPKKPFLPKPVERIELPAKDTSFMAAVMAPSVLLLLVIIYGANVYSAYEIALFKGRPVPLVCGVSIVLPFVGPLVFLSLPGTNVTEDDGQPVASTEGTYDVNFAIPTVNSGLSMANKGGGQKAQAGLQPVTYTRNETTFDRRFFETKFAGFFRVVLGDAEKEMVIVFKTVKNEYIARRISRISGNEVHVQLLRGGTADVGITFGEITQVILRHKDAK